MSNAARPLPSIPKSDDSLDIGQVSSPGTSTPSTPSSEGRSLQSSASLPIMPPTVNVQFAPLPEIDPRDRKSTRPLGMAARSQMLQQRRQIQMQNGQRHPHEWSDPDDRPVVCISDEEEEDPLETFARFIADKSKSLWKRVTSKTKQSDEDETVDIASEVEEERGAIQSRPPKREEVPSTSEGASRPSEGNFQKID